ncbi:hypothetical protein [Bradyrhizobium iriomotense]|uniref:hypothetical protein n=1 Tax=Bradyrhizobium iriomotense TaxID=441950 RepID=UPI001B8A4555|nr:hypothetical protein [Bradyrhizobium iriomotense]MBR1132543.1 hypothetical protein [Bradyrhizobium iriomotense]
MQQQTIQRETHFWERSCQYYVVGRFAFMAGLHPVAANLLHHAVEFALKGALARNKTLKDLRNQLHKLPDLWTTFKAEIADGALGSFDPVIATLHSHWSLRYPDDVLKNGMEVVHTTHRTTIPDGFPRRTPPAHLLPPEIAAQISERLAALPEVKQYETLCLQDVDELIEGIFDAAKRNPRQFFNGMNPKALQTLAEGNFAAGLLK